MFMVLYEAWWGQSLPQGVYNGSLDTGEEKEKKTRGELYLQYFSYVFSSLVWVGKDTEENTQGLEERVKG